MENENELHLKKGLDVIQSMIDISADRLEGLRTQCNSSAELTQQEIRTLETKLVKMFSELLIRKEKLPKNLQNISNNGREIKQWLRVVGLSGDSLNAVIHSVNSLEMLICKNEIELRKILTDNSQVRDEEVRRLIRAMNCLKICQSCIKNGRKDQSDLFWDSWDRHHHTQLKQGTSPRNEKGKVNYKVNRHQHPHTMNYDSQINSHEQQSPLELSPPDHVQVQSSDELSFHTLTPSPSPPNSPANNSKSKTKGFPTTPPPKKKHQTLVSATSGFGTPPPHSNNIGASCNTVPHPNGGQINSLDQQFLSKSRSHEFHLQQQLQIQEYNNQESQLQHSVKNQENNHATLTSSNSHQPSSTQYTSNSDSIMTDSGIHIHSSATTINKSECNSNVSYNMPTPRSRLHTEPGPDTDIGESMTSNSLTVPRSPCTPIITRGMGHMIQHRFTKNFRVTACTCDLCNKQMFFGFKCTECKYRCHKDCKPNVPPSCGLPQEFVDEFKKTLQSDNIVSNTSPSLGSRNFLSSNRRDKSRIQPHNVHGPDSSSAGSSCNSSSPSSPALLNSFNYQTPAPSTKSQFNFPEVSPSTIANGNNQKSIRITTTTIDDSGNGSELEKQKADYYQGSQIQHTESVMTNSITYKQQNLSELTDTHKSNDSDKTMSLTGSNSTSTDSDRTPVRLDSMEERESANWPRQNSLSLKEWDIPYDDLKLLEKIGKGRFGTVHRALWHGDVAVKILKPDYLDDESTIEAFKLEVATFKKTRHENLVLFMGACMKPPRLAIVTSLCKGSTLYTHIHLRKDKFTLNRTTLVAQQISQGMGYLHARGIVHKDLKTKNIFLENGKVIITDFGLFSATKLSYTEHGLGIARGWLCYLAPELIKGLKPFRPTDEDLPFSKGSDVHAFGTVWYELLCGEFPFKSQPHESVIWQVGRGMKQTLANLQASRDIKDILMMCWAFEVDTRPDFAKLLQLLERLPKKRLARSPSHPVQLSRSAESVF
uniref:CSON000374 protein n=1 Tax=Culicoides sonorensis TaxID=179676 RepID=A0A336MFK1_CULSO